MRTRYLTASVLSAALAGIWIGHGGWHPPVPGAAPSHSPAILYYQDSMHPWVKSDHPGKCTVCGMDLTPIHAGEAGFVGGENDVMLSSNNITVMNIQTEEVKQQEVSRTLLVAGTLEADETRKTVVAAPAAGRIDDLTVRFPGVEVKEGERLVTFYSPELTLEKRRFLVRSRMSTQRDPTGGLAQLQSDSDPYYSDLISPQAGTVVERRAYKGQYVADGEKLFTIVDLSVLWFRFDVYEQQLPWLALGQAVDVSIAAVPGKTFKAVISFIEPMLNESTRTIKVRAELRNPVVDVNGQSQRVLSLGMFAQGEVRSRLKPLLAVSRSAVLFPGGQAYAYVDQGKGVYEKRRLKLGHQGDALWEVTEGLKEGERVVTSGNVLIDAQAQFTRTDGSADFATGNAGKVQADPGVELSPALLTEKIERQGMKPKGDFKMEMSPSRLEGAGVPPASLNHPKGMVAREDSAPARAPLNPRQPMPSVSSIAHPGFRNNRLATDTSSFAAAFTRVAELRSSELNQQAAPAAVPRAALSGEQLKELHEIMKAADEIARALAEDRVDGFWVQFGALKSAVAPALLDFAGHDSLGALVQKLKPVEEASPAGELALARTQFLPVAETLVQLAGNLRKREQSFAGLKIYHCPMAPKPGLWVQSQGPLLNPFLGGKMPGCGEEVLP